MHRVTIAGRAGTHDDSTWPPGLVAADDRARWAACAEAPEFYGAPSGSDDATIY